MKIKCPDGTRKTIEECKDCPNHCVPKPVRHALLHGRERKKRKNEKPQYGIGSLVSNCLRQSYYKITEEVVHSMEKLWIFSRGHAIHDYVTKTLDEKEKEIFVKKEFPSFNVIGFVDAVHDDIIYEFKTTTNIPETPQKHHALQGQGYFSILSPERQRQIKKIIVVYLSMQKIKTFEVPKRDIIGFLESRAAQLTLALKDKVPPEKETSWLCKYCDFYDICFGQQRLFV